MNLTTRPLAAEFTQPRPMDESDADVLILNIDGRKLTLEFSRKNIIYSYFHFNSNICMQLQPNERNPQNLTILNRSTCKRKMLYFNLKCIPNYEELDQITANISFHILD